MRKIETIIRAIITALSHIIAYIGYKLRRSIWKKIFCTLPKNRRHCFFKTQLILSSGRPKKMSSKMEIDEGSNVFYSILFKNPRYKKDDCVHLHIIMSSFFYIQRLIRISQVKHYVALKCTMKQMNLYRDINFFFLSFLFNIILRFII